MNNLLLAVLIVIVSAEELHRTSRRLVHSNLRRIEASPSQRRNFSHIPVTINSIFVSPYLNRANLGPYLLITPRFHRSPPTLTRPVFVTPYSARLASRNDPNVRQRVIPNSILQRQSSSKSIDKYITPREMGQKRIQFSSPNIVRKTSTRRPISGRYSVSNPDTIHPKRKVIRYPLIVTSKRKRIHSPRFPYRSPIATILSLPTIALHLVKRLFRPLMPKQDFQSYRYYNS